MRHALLSQRQGADTIISWLDPEVGTDLAISFQEAVGCNYIWEQIQNVQTQYLADKDDGKAGSAGGAAGAGAGTNPRPARSSGAAQGWRVCVHMHSQVGSTRGVPSAAPRKAEPPYYKILTLTLTLTHAKLDLYVDEWV